MTPHQATLMNIKALINYGKTMLSAVKHALLLYVNLYSSIDKHMYKSDKEQGLDPYRLQAQIMLFLLGQEICYKV